MWEILLELLEFLGFIGLKKKKKKEKELTRVATDDSTYRQHSSGQASRRKDSVCAGCHLTIKEGAVYELGKAWCTECYKIHVLKIKS